MEHKVVEPIIELTNMNIKTPSPIWVFSLSLCVNIYIYIYSLLLFLLVFFYGSFVMLYIFLLFFFRSIFFQLFFVSFLFCCFFSLFLWSMWEFLFESDGFSVCMFIYLFMCGCVCVYFLSSALSWFALCNIFYMCITLNTVCVVVWSNYCIVRLFVWSVLTLSYPLFISFGFLMHSQVFLFSYFVCIGVWKLVLFLFIFFHSLCNHNGTIKCIDIFHFTRSKVLYI